MVELIIAEREDLVAIANAVRSKTGKTEELTLSEIVSDIDDIEASSDPILQDKIVTPTTSQQSITADSGYDGLDTVTVNAMPTATQATPSITVDANGLITATATQTAGYVAAGTESSTHQLAFQPAKIITPSTTSQVAVSSGYYIGGDVTVAGDSNLVAENIAKGVSIFGVEGTKDDYLGHLPFTYTMEDVDGEEYGFTLNKDGYYESSGHDMSHSSCKINLIVNEICDIEFLYFIDFYNNGSTYLQFGIMDAVFTDIGYYEQITLTPTEGSVIYNNVSVGTHHIYIKAYKGNYVDSGRNTAAFKIVSSKLSEETNKKICALDTDLVANNIKSGIDIFGISGAYTGNTDMEDLLVTRDLNILEYTNDRVSSIGEYAFYENDCFSKMYFPSVQTIGGSAFQRCSYLTTANFPIATSIFESAFQSCMKLSDINFPNVSIMSKNAFAYCSSLTTASFPNVIRVGDYAFASCLSLTTASFPNARTIGSNAFARCSNLTTTSFPNVAVILSYAFASCSSLTTASFPNASTIYSYAFRACYNLKSLYLTGSSICALLHSSAFTSTPIGGYSTSAGTYGSIYVPASLLTSYQTATNWAYFSSRFVGI